MPGSLRQLGRVWNLALKELPTEICLLLVRTGTWEGENCTLGLCPFLSENSIHLVEIYRNVT